MFCQDGTNINKLYETCLATKHESWMRLFVKQALWHSIILQHCICGEDKETTRRLMAKKVGRKLLLLNKICNYVNFFFVCYTDYQWYFCGPLYTSYLKVEARLFALNRQIFVIILRVDLKYLNASLLIF